MFFVGLSVLMIVLEKYFALRVGRFADWGVGGPAAEVRRALRLRGVAAHILLRSRWWLHPAGSSCSACRSGATATGRRTSPRNSSCCCSSSTSPSPRSRSAQGFRGRFLFHRYPEQTTLVQAKTAEDVSTLGFYWYRVRSSGRFFSRSPPAFPSSTKSTRFSSGRPRAPRSP